MGPMMRFFRPEFGIIALLALMLVALGFMVLRRGMLERRRPRRRRSPILPDSGPAGPFEFNFDIDEPAPAGPCPHCGENIRTSWRVCPHCGKALV